MEKVYFLTGKNLKTGCSRTPAPAEHKRKLMQPPMLLLTNKYPDIMNDHNTGASDKNQSSKVNELQAVFELLKAKPATATEAALILNIYRPSLCRCKRTLEKAGLLVELQKTKCPITKHTAWLLSTNPNLFFISSQLTFNF